MIQRAELIEKIFSSRDESGLWKMIPSGHKYYPDYLHYVPNYKASLWTLILLADLKCDPLDERIRKPLQSVKDHLFDEEHGIYSLKEDHFPIPCLNGNLLYLDAYFNAARDFRNEGLLDFFSRNQRFDDGEYIEPKNRFCSNTSCYGKHTCYWGVVKLLKGISFVPRELLNDDWVRLRNRCVDFVLKHKIWYSSHHPDKIMISKLDLLTFPNFYKGDFLEILWILKREGVVSSSLVPALKMLKSKQQNDGTWNLERKMHNMVVSVGTVERYNPFVSERAQEVLTYYQDKLTLEERIIADD